MPRLSKAAAMVLGCSGGVGTSTIWALSGASHDLGVKPPGRFIRHPLLLVTRRTALGTRRLAACAEQLRGLGYRPVLVAVGDGPWPDPVPARARLRMLVRQGFRVIRFPYVAQWRHIDDVTRHIALFGLPPQAYAAARKIRAEITGAAGGGGFD